jgi:nucleotide-binding universal stress UspA family protein
MEQKINNIHRVVIPVDSTDVSRVAAEQGAYFAKLLNVEVTIISVNDAENYMLSALLEEQLLIKNQELVEEIKLIAQDYGVAVNTKMCVGSPAEEIVKCVNDDDLIVMASQGKKGFNRFLLGSVSEEVLKTAPCPVMIIKEKRKKRSVEFLDDRTGEIRK